MAFTHGAVFPMACDKNPSFRLVFFSLEVGSVQRPREVLSQPQPSPRWPAGMTGCAEVPGPGGGAPGKPIGNQEAGTWGRPLAVWGQPR